MGSFLKSPLTTIGGILMAVGQFFAMSEDPLFKMIGTVLTAVGAFMVGGSAIESKQAAEMIKNRHTEIDGK